MILCFRLPLSLHFAFEANEQLLYFTNSWKFFHITANKVKMFQKEGLPLLYWRGIRDDGRHKERLRNSGMKKWEEMKWNKLSNKKHTIWNILPYRVFPWDSKPIFPADFKQISSLLSFIPQNKWSSPSLCCLPCVLLHQLQRCPASLRIHLAFCLYQGPWSATLVSWSNCCYSRESATPLYRFLLN